LAYDLAC